jgi:transposase-like protein
VFGARASKETISRITEKVIGEMTEWQNRPLDRVYPVVFNPPVGPNSHRLKSPD